MKLRKGVGGHVMSVTPKKQPKEASETRTVRLSAELISELEKEKTESGQSMSKVFEYLLRLALGLDAKQGKSKKT